MMRRSEKNMTYYIDKEPAGCLMALEDGKPVGSIISHVWGSVGWFGPLEVEPERQARGIGKALVESSINYLKERGCRTIGCETMASSPKNIAFYMKMGFRAKSLSNVMYKRLGPVDPQRLRQNPAKNLLDGDLEEARELWNRIQPGIDYTPEIAAVTKHNLGEIWTLENGAHAIVHNYEMFSDSHNSIIKLVAAPKTKSETVRILLERCELSAAQSGNTGMFLRTYDATPPDLNMLFNQGYILQSNSIRLILTGNDEDTEEHHISCWSG